MAALALNGGPDGPRRRSLPIARHLTWGRATLVGGIALVAFMIWTFMTAQIVSKRPSEMKTTQVILPPPPTPPPPPEVKPQEKPPEPKEAPPIEQPQDNPPPPDQAKPSEPTQGDSALTAREGAGPSNYGLAVGNGSGTRIGGRPGGSGNDGFAAYAGVVRSAIQLATQSDRELARGRYTVRLMVRVDEAGRVTDVRVIDSSGDSRRDARLRSVLVGLQISRTPPPGLPPMRLELATRSGA
ncbi:cell envelope integrity protein TolA [Sphingomonadaceae bacterium jetA1]|jgi:outer membrane biosynthesis protein TonB|uniref:cell envelope integrity protein TolA n=1 Tax=Facivitalis istanbulensis TaxID=3075838 RepID=UPI003480B5F1